MSAGGLAVVLREQHRLVGERLGGARRVLEVGCGGGALAAAMAAEGREVTAIDLRLPEPRPDRAVRWIQGDYLALSPAVIGEAFDAVVFTASLHHIHPLDRALERAHALLRPGGQLVLDELDLDAVDAATARWFYEIQELLVAAGCYPRDRVDGEADDDDPRRRWLDAHVHHGEPPLHGGRAMIDAVETRFRHVAAERCPYLYRYIAAGVEGRHAEAIADHVLAAEWRRLAVGAPASGGLVPVGLILAATR